MKLSYVNAVAELCERLGADILDTQALLQVAGAADFEFRLMRASIDTNTRQRQRMVDKIRLAITGNRNDSLTHSRVALLGLTFKAGTNDLRDSPSRLCCGSQVLSWLDTIPHSPHRRRIRIWRASTWPLTPMPMSHKPTPP